MNQRVLGMCGYSRATVTRPNDTNQYTAGDAISDSTSAPTVMTFRNAIREGSGAIQQAYLLDSANQSTKLDAELWLFSTAPTAVNDNAAITFTDAELANLVAVIDFSVADAKVGLATSGAGGNAINIQGSLGIPVSLQAHSNDLFGVLVARNAYTPVAQEAFTITLAMVY
jgi:hypothetical protein